MAKKKPPAVNRGLKKGAFLLRATLQRDRIEDLRRHPFDIPAIASLGTLELHPKVTFFVGENGSGKSTLLEALAIASGFNAEGGTKNFRFSTAVTESNLHKALWLDRSVFREQDGFFLRAESFFNVATEIERLSEDDNGPSLFRAYGGTSLHRMSHGEAFLALVEHRFGDNGLFLLDEPEAALSPQRQLALLAFIDLIVQRRGGQMVIATHSPILLAYPDASILSFDEGRVRRIEWAETEHVKLTRDFLAAPERFFRTLFRHGEE